MFRVYDIHIIVQSKDADDCEDSDSIVEQLANLIEVRRLELGECKPRFVGARITDTDRMPSAIRKTTAPRVEEASDV